MKKNPVINKKRVVSIKSDIDDQFLPDLTLKEIQNILSKYIIVEMKPSVVGEGKDKLKIIYIEAKGVNENVIIMVQVFDDENTKDVISALKLGASVSQVMLNNPVYEINEGDFHEVYRIQNEKGVGPYQDKNSPISKIFSKVTQPGAISRAMLATNLDPVMFALIDTVARTNNTTGDIFRVNPKDDTFDHSDLTFMRKQKALTGFIDIEQLFKWFRNADEINWLANNGYLIYKIKSHNIRVADSQCLFLPDEIGTPVLEFTNEEKKIFSKYNIPNIKLFVQKSLELNQ